MQHHRTLIAMAAAMALPTVHAFELDSGDPDTRIRLDFTAKYSLAQRLHDPSAALLGFNPAVDPGTINEDDGNKNFRKGLISNRIDLLGEFDVSSQNWGLRLSGTGLSDSVYRRSNDGSGPANNNLGQPANEFLPSTRKQHGSDTQLLDAFVYLKGDLGGGASGTVRLGKHSLQWGESLFFGQNGIANAQGPVDVAKILSVPGWQYKEVLLPVEQLSTSIQLRPGLSVGGYYQFKWRPSRIPGVGSYFSNQDYVGTGVTYMGPQVLVHDDAYDGKPKNSGQGGLQIRWAPSGSDFEFGFYAARYHDKTPSVPLFDVVNSRVNTVYAQGINTYGASVTASSGQLNWAAEASIRTNAPLNVDPAVAPGATCGNSGSETCYAVGKTAHINLSGIYVLQPSALWGGGALLAELAWNRKLSVTHGPSSSLLGGGAVDPNTTRDAAAMRVVFAPSYFQVLPQLDLTVPMSLGYNFGGRSSAIGNFAGGVSRAGDFSIGLQGKYEQAWTAQINFTHYFGKAATYTQTMVPGSGAPRQLSFGQSLKDRDYVSLSVQRTF